MHTLFCRQIHVLQLLEPAGFSNASTIANSALSTDGSLGASPPAADGSSAGTGEQTSSGPGRRVRHVKTHRVWANGSGWEPIPVKELVAGWLSGRERNYGVYLLACDAAGRALSAAVLHIQHARDLPQAEVRRRRRSAEPARGGSKKPCLVLFTESARHQREAAEHAALYSKPGALRPPSRTARALLAKRSHFTIVCASALLLLYTTASFLHRLFASTSLKFFFSQPPAAIYTVYLIYIYIYIHVYVYINIKH